MELKQSIPISEAKRKLVSIQRIKDVQPIENADAIEKAKILGWDVVIKKNSSKAGDLVAYFEIDSFLPVSEYYEFLGKPQINPISKGTSNEEWGIRLRTVKLRGQVSQGLIVRLEDLDHSFSSLSKEEFMSHLKSLPEGSEITSLLGVIKYEKEEVSGDLGTLVGSFPEQYAPKTDEERIQNEPESYKEILGESYYISSKVDGTSITVSFVNGEFIFATRNNRLSNENKIKDILKERGTLDLIRKNGENITIQSELYGSKIQSNRLGIRGRRLATFTILKDGEVVGLEKMLDYVDKLNLEIPEILEIGSNDEQEIARIVKKIESINSKREKVDPIKSADGLLRVQVNKVSDDNFNYSISDLINKADNTKYSTNGSQQEGFVVRPIKGPNSFYPVSFKVVNNKFLLKEK